MEPVANTQPIEVHARVAGENITEMPMDLYIPPGALRVFLETFEGPLDLLLYLIKKQNFDILDIPVAEITRQYMTYVEVMQELEWELAAEYLLMAAMLAEIKSRLLLPRPPNAEAIEDDPRAELVRRLQEYERFKQAAESLDQLPRLERDVFLADAATPAMQLATAQPHVSMDALMQAITDVIKRAKLYTQHQIRREFLSIRERMVRILERVDSKKFVSFTEFFEAKEGKMGVVVTLIAILELIRRSVLELTQAEAFAPIYIRNRSEIGTENDDRPA